MTSPPFVVYGAGAIGGVIAARLRLAGNDVTAVARGEHLDAIRSSGLTLVTQAGSESVDVVGAAGAAEIDWSTAPVVVLAVKSHQTASALDDLAAHAPVATAVFTAQNGVANEPAVLRRFPNVYPVTVMQPATHLEPGIVIQQSYPVAGILDTGRFPTGRDDVAERVSGALRAAQFVSEVRDDIMRWKYRKLILNLGNGVSAVYRPGVEADELVARARREAETVLTAVKISFVSAAEDRQRRANLLQGRVRTDAYGSTWQSITRGHAAVETDYFNGEIVLQARLHGLSAPVNEYLQRVASDHARNGLPPRSVDPAAALRDLAEQRPAPTV